MNILHKTGYRGCQYLHSSLLHSMCRAGCSDTKIRYTTQSELKLLNSSNHIRVYSSDQKQTALSVMKDLKHLKSSPFPALVLGGTGLIPFIAAPLYMTITGGFVASLAYSQVAYGAVILSFVGAVRWGMALSENGIVRPNWINLGYSVTPSLIAWAALMMSTPFSLATLMLGLGGAAYMDITMYGYPSWFKAMRFLLSIIAILSLWTTLLLHYIKFGSVRKGGSEAKKETKHSTKAVEKAVVQAVSEIDPVADVILADSTSAGKASGTDSSAKRIVYNRNFNNKTEANTEVAVLQAVSEIDPVADVVLAGNKTSHERSKSK